MRAITRVARRYLLVAATAIGLAHARPPVDAQRRLDAWIQEKPGGIALAWVDGDGATYFTAGKNSETDHQPITPDTPFALGSVTKLFTAALLVETERAGKVGQGTTAARLLFPADDPTQQTASGLTLRMLASHRAGLPTSPRNFLEHRGPPADPFVSYGRAPLLEAFQTHAPRAPVNRTTVYSNFGVAVLGEALAAAWRTSYREALRTQVLEPLGMRQSDIVEPGGAANLPPDHVRGSPVGKWTFQAGAPAGGLRSTARDMARFLSACLAPAPSAFARALQAMFVVQAKAEDFGCDVGLGWFIDRHEDEIAWHAGATGGARAFMAVNRTRGQGVVVLANSDNAVSALGADLIHLKQFTWPVPPAVVSGAARFAGQYARSNKTDLQILARDGALFVKLADWEDALPLRQLAPDRFAIMLMPAELSFERGAKGMIVGVVTDVEGEREVAARRN